MKLMIPGNGPVSRFINNRVVLHLFYWIAYVCFFGIIWGTYDMDFKKTFSVELISLPVKIFLVYFVLFVLMPRFLFKRKTLVFFILLFVLLVFASVAQRYLDNYIILDNYFPHWEKVPVFSLVTMISTVFKLSVVLAIPATVKTMNYFRIIQQRQQDLEKEKLQAELAALKNQVHPHFLFNTLNSLYSLILKKSDLALDVILRFSDLLRYLLYETNHARVEISREIDFVKNYLDLERLRFGKKLYVDMRLNGDFTNRYIAPMVILPFVENSIKHSSGSSKDRAEVFITMEINGKGFFLEVKNNMPVKTNLTETGGIGLQNVKKRLDILYENNYDLDIRQEADSYSVKLQITV
jgi:sensor histidine kinase YesM